MDEKDILNFSKKVKELFAEIKKDIVGQEEVVEKSIIAMIAGGNILLEGVPGVGKTRLVRVLSRVFDMPFSRIQFTPDLMPSDVTGVMLLVKDKNENSKFEFQKGPIFSNLVLADEINRATPKTQSALLEAMQEQKVTVMGKTFELSKPFFVLATQNPIEQDGTYPLPEAQLDRFMFKIIVKNPKLDELIEIVNLTQKTMDETSNKICNSDELLMMREVANSIVISSDVMKFAMKLCLGTSKDSECKTDVAKKYIQIGASPRAGQALISAAKVKALLSNRYNVSYQDIIDLAHPVLRHRIKLNFEAISDSVSEDDVIDMLVREVKK